MTGECEAVSNEPDPDSCSGSFTCSALGACLLKNGASCSADNACASGCLQRRRVLRTRL